MPDPPPSLRYRGLAPDPPPPSDTEALRQTPPLPQIPSPCARPPPSLRYRGLAPDPPPLPQIPRPCAKPPPLPQIPRPCARPPPSLRYRGLAPNPPRLPLRCYAPDGPRPLQVLAGYFGLALPDLPALCARLAAVAPRLTGTQFRWEDTAPGACVTVQCPWGNVFLCYSSAPPDPPDPLSAGVPSSALAEAHRGAFAGLGVRCGAAPAARGAGVRFVAFRHDAPAEVARWYREVMGCRVLCGAVGELEAAAVTVGPGVHFIFLGVFG